ncbi:hypothetical protein [Nocardioides sp. NPDC127503]|uniref:hypothetical protein n=1 Tax=Nocardioides sp. NPDC127503 TaxID=3154516 RepID=UPI003324C21A
MTAPVQLSSLNLGDQLAEGGQGAVHELLDQPELVFKRYLYPDSPAFRPDALQRLVDCRPSIAFSGRSVDEFAAWPTAVVNDGTRTVGFLMRRVPTGFTLAIGGKVLLADLSYLATEPKPIWGDVDLPGMSEKVQVLQHLAGAVDAFHARQIVVGDISYANVLWSRDPQPRVMLIDCDGMRHAGMESVLPQADTPDWEDPMPPAGYAPGPDQDRYKLALAVRRVLTSSLDARLTSSSPDLSEVGGAGPKLEALLARAAGPAGTRPSAREWFDALSGRATQPVRQGERREIDAPAARPDLLTSSTSERKFRPVTPPGS